MLYHNIQTFLKILVRHIIGNIIRIVDKDLKTIVEYKYDAFGNFTKELYTEVINAGTIEQQNHFYYKGYCLDKETGLYYCNSRYYDPSIGRWISPDDISYLDYAVIGGSNLYVYCGNNPVMYSDPSGNFAISTFLIGLAVSSLVTWAAGELFGHQLVGGAGSIVTGGNAIYTGVSLIAFGGPVGWILGSAALISGIASVGFGAAEIQEHFTGNNYIKEWGITGNIYNGLMITSVLTAGITTVAGQRYLRTHAKVADLNNTHGKTLSNRKYNDLRGQIMNDGIKNPMDVVKYNGSKYVVNGNHRLMIARELGIKIVRINYVGLPFLGYITPMHLFY